MAEGQADDALINEIRERHVATGNPSDPHCEWCSGPDYPIWPCDTAYLLNRLDALTAERDAQSTAVRELHEAALEKECNRTQHWMDQRDKFCDQLADEKKAHALTQGWLDKFQSEAATQQVRAIKAEQALAKVEAERDALRGWQDGQTHYVGCWREHRRCALTTIDFEAARRERAELALREAVAELNRLREGQDDERR